MATKRRKKQWWQMLRGPRGHRGLPGAPAPAGTYTQGPQIDVSKTLEGYVSIGLFLQLRDRVAELERKLEGSQK